MKNIIVMLLLMCSTSAKAQVQSVSIQASGLTCSMCSNAIRKALESDASVLEVKANIKNSSFDVRFKPLATIDFDGLKHKVEEAGFFVARFDVRYHVDHLPLTPDAHVKLNGYLFHVLNTTERTMGGDVQFQILDRGFVTAKEYKKNARLTQMTCYQTGQTSSCCVGKQMPVGNRIYHIQF
ncbi:MAG TPA: heavy-metal-associated domain-containing protein [Ferruginibacter sp.]|nr:heavy-metal-associated domain-containing protein [Ferruginibacter sp.]